MRFKLAAVLLVIGLAATPAPDTHAAPLKAKRCYAKKHGKRTRVKCPKKKKKKATPAPAPAPAPGPAAPVVEPQLTAAVQSLLTSHMLHRFATSASPAEALLHMCPGARYQYIDFADPTGMASNAGAWRVTGAESTPPSVTAGLLLNPSNGAPPQLLVLTITDNGDGTQTVTVNGEQWYLGPSTLCPPGSG